MVAPTVTLETVSPVIVVLPITSEMDSPVIVILPQRFRTVLEACGKMPITTELDLPVIVVLPITSETDSPVTDVLPRYTRNRFACDFPNSVTTESISPVTIYASFAIYRAKTAIGSAPEPRRDRRRLAGSALAGSRPWIL